MSCPVSKICGGCEYIDISYEEQLKRKQKLCNDLLSSICKVNPIIGAEDPYHYRNKVHGAFSSSKSGLKCGRYQEKTHKIIECFDCDIEDIGAQKIIEDVKLIASKSKIRIYDEVNRTGTLRRVLVRCSKSSGKYMLVLVSAVAEFPGKRNFIKAITSKHKEIVTVIFNVNSRNDSMILGDKSYVEYGPGFLYDELCGLKFKISDKSFYQINHDQTELLYGKAIEYADIKEGQKVLDCYCGIGTIGMSVAKAVPSSLVTGVELNKAACSDATTNKKLNDLRNVRIEQGDATEYMVNSSLRGNHFDVIILDPPRSGTTPEFIEACRKANPNKIVYVSCDPNTLARDLKIFDKNGYKAIEATPVDMFPFTKHCESVCLLSKVNTRD